MVTLEVEDEGEVEGEEEEAADHMENVCNFVSNKLTSEVTFFFYISDILFSTDTFLR